MTRINRHPAVLIFTVEPPVSDHQKGAALVVGFFIWEVVYNDTKVGQQGNSSRYKSR